LPPPYLAWSPDGSSLVISDRGSHTEPVALFLLSVETGEKRRLTSPPAQFAGDSCPAFSPEGRRLAFSRSGAGGGDVYLLALSARLNPAGVAKRLTFGNRGVAGTAWTTDGHEIVFSTGLGRTSLWKIGVSGSAEPQPLVSLGENAFCPAISRGGRRLAYAHEFFHSSIWRMAAPASPSLRAVQSLKPLNRAIPLISSTRNSLAPQYSPDSKRVAFMSARSGGEEIWMCDSDGANAIQLTSFGGPSVTTPRWSPDGRRIAFDSTAEGQFDIWVVGANGGKPQRMTTNPADDGNPSWSRDGRWIYFDSGRTGEEQVWKMPANGGEAVQLTRDGGLAPLESPDGKFLYYVKSLVATSLWKIPVEGGQTIKVLEGLSTSLNLAIVDSGLYFVPEASSGSGSSIQFLNFATNRISPVADFEKPLSVGAGGGLAVSPNGRWILYTQADQAGSELMLVENFR
jgi:Tol biopolymer transport system component